MTEAAHAAAQAASFPAPHQPGEVSFVIAAGLSCPSFPCSPWLTEQTA